ncbi:hypothetical protein AZ66_16320 [Paenibacillus sp. E194]|jgi:N-acetylglucosamine malate deacetylase 1|uniref:LmbE family protein n=1 Tax=Paenibacillus alvei TS-15 TaxID=1117108 RepID=S9U9N1_PAEAL|nr:MULTISPECIES: PIG-L family deacetylase [Paenibacillus]EPY07185.1 hypothetical protein PAALTS15_10334 [Paenibacillus alvei TS-15]KJB86875.1 hypothetical protein AZ66_16320 [Paenibacillus sp. E194]
MVLPTQVSARNILVLAPHTDDAELGCGAFIAKQIESGANVVVAAFSVAEQSLPGDFAKDTLAHEFHASMDVLEIPHDNRIVYRFPVRQFPTHRQELLEVLVGMKRDMKPDLVLVPSSSDIHQDHQVICSESQRAFKEQSLYGYELPWNQLSTNSRIFAPLDRKYMERKWEALQQYRSQLHLNRSYFTREMVFGLAKIRGVQIGEEYAEAFEPLRVRI